MTDKMKTKKLWVALPALLLLTACHQQATQTEEQNRIALEATFEVVECVSYNHHLLDSLDRRVSDPDIAQALVGYPACSSIESRFAENTSGIRIHWFRDDLPYFVIQDSTGNMRAFSDFRDEKLPQAIDRRGRDVVLKESVPDLCATQTGMVGDTWMALVTPKLRCSDWRASGGERFLDFYRLSDGRYLGSADLPAGPVETQWIQAIWMQGEDLRILFTDRKSGSACRYHVQFNLPNE